MRHPERVWTDPSNEHLPLRTLADEYLHWLRSRPKPASPATVRKYRQAIERFILGVEERGDPAELGSLTLGAIGRWVGGRRARGLNASTRRASPATSRP
jgi:hypothetical protein